MLAFGLEDQSDGTRVHFGGTWSADLLMMIHSTEEKNGPQTQCASTCRNALVEGVKEPPIFLAHLPCHDIGSPRAESAMPNDTLGWNAQVVHLLSHAARLLQSQSFAGKLAPAVGIEPTTN
jgi:hypothetical protein